MMKKLDILVKLILDKYPEIKNNLWWEYTREPYFIHNHREIHPIRYSEKITLKFPNDYRNNIDTISKMVGIEFAIEEIDWVNNQIIFVSW